VGPAGGVHGQGPRRHHRPVRDDVQAHRLRPVEALPDRGLRVPGPAGRLGARLRLLAGAGRPPGARRTGLHRGRDRRHGQPAVAQQGLPRRLRRRHCRQHPARPGHRAEAARGAPSADRHPPGRHLGPVRRRQRHRGGAVPPAGHPPDRVTALKQLAARHPWSDIDRVGIWGHSGGGNATAAAMFHYPDFFKVGWSESGNHDNRNYEDDWAEKWQGLLVTNEDGSTNYDTQANWRYAKNLKGRLMLTHGTLDDNVPPSMTLLVVKALIEANKDFDMIMIPNARHGYGKDTPYIMRRRWDYFVQHLAGNTPPDQYRMQPPES